jgi:hypothetical protein
MHHYFTSRRLEKGGHMTVSRNIKAGLIMALLISAKSLAVNSPTSAAGEPESAMTLMPCALLTADVAKRLPGFIKPSDVLCMSVTSEDVQSSERARLLLIEAGSRVQSEGRLSNARAEYDRGIGAYAEGRYLEAVSHFQSAVSAPQ